MGLDEVALELGRGVVEPFAPEAVVGQATLLGQRHEAGGPELREVVLDRRLGELEALGDLREVLVAVAQEAQDPQARVVAERACRRSTPWGGASGSCGSRAHVGDGVDEDPPVAAVNVKL